MTVQTEYKALSKTNEIRSRPCPTCYICGTDGGPLYQYLEDRYWGALGQWSLRKCRNDSCGLVWLDPMPIQEDIAEAYEHYYTHWDSTDEGPSQGLIRRFIRSVKAGYLDSKYGYGRGGPKSYLGLLAYFAPLRRAGSDFSVMYLRFSRGGRLLEVGCGSGDMLKGMADLGWQVEGVDFDPAAVESCGRKGLNVRVGFLEQQRYPANYYDAVTMSHLIEHVHEPLELLVECYRILKPDGHLSLVTPNINSAGHRIYGSSWFHLDPPRHLRIFSVTSLKVLLQKAGFRSMKIHTTIRDAAGAYVGSRSIRRMGRYEFGSRQPRSVRLWGHAMTALEWAWLNLNDQVGEEIAVVAQK
jgi:2-polyprenyl-3-methyl-5-hydroxy-6-metoxy-1,4-benzoquinol methylase